MRLRARLFVAALAWSSLASAAKIACVGDSITYGYGLSDPNTQSYPAVLATHLGSAHTVMNFGVSGATLLKNGDKPYWNETNYTASGSFDPDVVVIMLGTNDAKPQNWSHKSEFAGDYAELIAHYRSLGALVYIAAPPPVYPPGAYGIPVDVVANEVVPLVHTIATDAGTPLIDVFMALSNKSEDFPDLVHPNAAGASLLADTVLAALNEYGFGGAGGMGGAGGRGGGAGMGGRQGFAGNSGTGGLAALGGLGGMGGSGGNGGANTAGGGAAGGGTGGAAMNGGVGATGGMPGAAGAVGGSSGKPGGAGSGAVGLGGSMNTSSAAGGAGGATSGAGSSIAGALSQAGNGSANASSNDGSGCGCRVVTSSETPRLAWLLLALPWVLRRRHGRANRRDETVSR